MDSKIREPYEPWYYRTINFDNMQSAAIDSAIILNDEIEPMLASLVSVLDIMETLRMAEPSCAVNFWPEEMPNLQNYNAREHFKGFPEEIR